MRLEDFEKKAIKNSIDLFLNRKDYSIYLFGSRIDDSKRGGDIDLLLVLNNIQDKNLALLEKHKILSEIKSRIGDQKIDLIIALIAFLPQHLDLINIFFWQTG